ncbi:hypothetical protein [Bacillus sp. FJAT-50079]|uniref:capping complex subunit for YIEGIA n=1 Tax=Bacillus sp. FJAT-50079 TaxID=2833577 RepID=UPI001BCA4CEB|nr:hypothetical protein [Bacillus sp. FJAT-50079]MBS4210271.1 hypothetical protein [Bacillus sp. FJAT-50079]
MSEHAVIIAVVTMNEGRVQGGGAPIFIVKNKEEVQTVSTSLEKIMDASAHEIDESTMIIVAR